MANEVKIELTVEEQQALRAISKVIKATDKLGDEAVKTAKRTDSAMSSFKGNLAAIAASGVFSAIGSGLSALKDGVVSAVDAAKELEVFETQFKTMLGSTKAAKDQLKELQDFAASTPFQLPGLALSTRQLLSFGVAQKDIIPTLQQLGDLAAGTGSSIDDLTIPFGRLISTQKLTLVELDKFADRGINIYKAFADQTGTSIKNVRDDISKGKIPFEEFTTAIGAMTSKGGLFFKGMEAQSETLSGKISTLEDNFFNLKGELGKAFTPAVKQGASELTDVMEVLTSLVRENVGPIKEWTSTFSKFLTDTAKGAVSFFTDGASEVNTLEEADKKIESLSIRLNDLRKERESNFFGSMFDGKELERTERQLLSLMKRREDIIGLAAADKQKDDFVGPPEPTPDDRVAKEKAVFDEIAAIRAEQRLLEQENILKEKEAKGTASETELEELRTFEMQKLELKRTTELEKAKFLGDADKTAKAQALINAKADLDTQKASGKASVALAKTIADEKINSQKSTFDTIATLSNSSNSTLAAIGKAAGITQIAIQTPVAVSKALAAFPPPFNFVAAGLVGTAMAAQAAKIAGVSGFANGGVVGGFQGATAGADNQLATVRSGEMFLNAPQQKQLFDVANGASSGGNSDAVMAALSQPIIIQVDNREIARANRTAVQEGFSAA